MNFRGDTFPMVCQKAYCHDVSAIKVNVMSVWIYSYPETSGFEPKNMMSLYDTL